MLELFLFMMNVAEAPPSKVMPLVCLESIIVTLVGLLEVFDLDVLVTTQCMSI